MSQKASMSCWWLISLDQSLLFRRTQNQNHLITQSSKRVTVVQVNTFISSFSISCKLIPMKDWSKRVTQSTFKDTNLLLNDCICWSICKRFWWIWSFTFLGFKTKPQAVIIEPNARENPESSSNWNGRPFTVSISKILSRSRSLSTVTLQKNFSVGGKNDFTEVWVRIRSFFW